MAVLKSARGVRLVLKVGDGGSPETFVAKCSINSERGITFSSATNDFDEIDCDDADAIAWLLREKSDVSAAFTGAGMLNTPDVEPFFDWLESEDSLNCLVVVDVPAVDGGIIFLGSWQLVEFAVTGARGAKQEVSISLSSDGALTHLPNGDVPDPGAGPSLDFSQATNSQYVAAIL
jgi:hypothetical protein